MSATAKPLTLVHPQGIGSVHFRWTDDRFDHSICFDQAEIECRPGSSKDAWPDSPPIQQLSIESIEGRNVALGVGCAGTSHWSLSVEPTSDGFRFDWACRAKETPGSLGTAYANHTSVRWEAEAGSAVCQETDLTRLRPDEPLAGAGTYRWCYTVSSA